MLNCLGFLRLFLPVCLFESFERPLLENFFENSGARGDNLRHYHVISMVPSVIDHLSSRPIRA